MNVTRCGRSVTTTGAAPKAAATIPTAPVPAPISSTDFPHMFWLESAFSAHGEKRKLLSYCCAFGWAQLMIFACWAVCHPASRASRMACMVCAMTHACMCCACLRVLALAVCQKVCQHQRCIPNHRPCIVVQLELLLNIDLCPARKLYLAHDAVEALCPPGSTAYKENRSDLPEHYDRYGKYTASCVHSGVV